MNRLLPWLSFFMLFISMSCSSWDAYNRLPFSWEPEIPFSVEGYTSCSSIGEVLTTHEDVERLNNRLYDDLEVGMKGVPAFVRLNNHWMGMGEELGKVVPCYVFGWAEYKTTSVLRFGFVETIGTHVKSELEDPSFFVTSTQGETYDEKGLLKSPLYEFYWKNSSEQGEE
jgi:hypothetical protein